MHLTTGITHAKLDGFADHPMADLLAELPEALAFIDAALYRHQMPPHTDSGDSDNRKISNNEEKPREGEEEEQRKGVVLVHCASGVSRSVSVCCAWLMTRQHLTYGEAITLIRVNRPNANPNVGFRTQLLALQDSGGDIIRAKQLHAERFGSSSSVVDIVRRQRQQACGLHEEVDKLEEEIKAIDYKYPSGCNKEQHGNITSFRDTKSMIEDNDSDEKVELLAEVLLHEEELSADSPFSSYHYPHQQSELLLLLEDWRRRLGLIMQSLIETDDGTGRTEEEAGGGAGGARVYLEDKPAQSMRKSAASKVKRLLEDVGKLQQNIQVVPTRE